MITLVRAVQTCIACPSQWDAWDPEGNYYYLRYRSGCGAVRQYKSEHWMDAPWRDDVDDTEPGWGIRANAEYIRTVVTFQYGDPLDGSISLERFAELAGLRLSPAIKRTAFWRHTRNQLAEDFADNPAAMDRVDDLLGKVNLDEE